MHIVRCDGCGEEALNRWSPPENWTRTMVGVGYGQGDDSWPFHFCPECQAPTLARMATILIDALAKKEPA